jgi:hypothetical protein
MASRINSSSIFAEFTRHLSVPLAIAGMLSAAACREPDAETTDASSPGSPDGTGRPDAAISNGEDGTPIRQPCTNNFGTKLTRDFGRLDGILVAVLDPMKSGTPGEDCNVDRTHVHLQIKAQGEIYDVAINIAVASTTVNTPLSGIPWTDGWHTGFGVDYVALGKPGAAFPDNSPAEIVDAIKNDLATVNHISVYGVGYGPDGAHLIHRNGRDRDGALVTAPLSGAAKWRLFKFSNQSF